MSDSEKAARYYQLHDELPSERLSLPGGAGCTKRQQHHAAVYRRRLDTGEKVEPEY